MPTKSEIASELATKFPECPTGTLANILYRENKLLFKDKESARRVLRYVRGASGDEARGKRERGDGILESPGNLNPFDSLPEGITHFEDRQPYFINGPARIGILSDLHIPYHNKEAVVTALSHIKKIKPTHIILNGDIADFFSVSFWEKDPKKRDLASEINTVREFLRVLRKTFPRTEIIYKVGNHEERWTRYLRVKAPEVLGVNDFELESILRLKDHNIQLVTDMRVIKAGGLNIIHGHEFRWGITSPVNPARGFYMRGKESCLGGHLHQSSSHSEKSMNNSVVTCWSIGCLCDMSPDYAPLNRWGFGFATVELSEDNNFQVFNYSIVKGNVYPA